MKQQPETLGEALYRGLKSQIKQVRRLSRQLQRQQEKRRSQVRQTTHPAQPQPARTAQPQQIPPQPAQPVQQYQEPVQVQQETPGPVHQTQQQYSEPQVPVQPMLQDQEQQQALRTPSQTVPPAPVRQPDQQQFQPQPARPAHEEPQMSEGSSPSYNEQEYTRAEAAPDQETEYPEYDVVRDRELQPEEAGETVSLPPAQRGQEDSFGSRGGGGSYTGSIEKPVQRSSGQQTEEVEIDLIDLFGYYMSRLPLLIAAVVIGALVSGIFTRFFIPNRYTAVSRMYMISASSDSVLNLSDLNLGASLSNDYVELMKSRPVVEEVIDTLGLEYTYEQVVDMIGLSVVANTRIVKISATSTDPYEAMQISNEMARVSKVQLPKVMDAPAPTIVEEAVLPAYRSSPSLSRNVMMGALLLLVLVLGVLTVFYLMDDTVKTSEDVEREFGIMPLTVIPEGTIEGLKKVEESRSERRRRYWKKTRKKKKKKKKK